MNKSQENKLSKVMKDDKIIQLINTCVREASLHSSPSAETLKMIEENKNTLSVMAERMGNIKDDFSEFKCFMSEFRNENNEYHKASNGRLKKLEVWRSLIIGGVLVANALFPFIIQYRIENSEYKIMKEMRMEIEKAITANNELQFEDFNIK